MSKNLSLALSDFRFWLPPAALFLIAFGFRLLGIGWGLPNETHLQSYHPDEGLIWVKSQTIQPAKLSFSPGFYNYGTLYLTSLKIASDVVAGYSGGGLDPNKPDDVWSYIAKCQLAGRILSALAGAGTALFIYLILRRLSTTFAGLMGGALIAFAPAFVVHSRFQTVDVLATFLLVFGTYFALRLGRTESEKMTDLKLVIWSGIFFGLSAGTKYTGILGVSTLLVMIFAIHGRPGTRLAIFGILATVAAFLIATPGAITDSAQFLRDFAAEMAHTSEGHGLVFEGTTSGFIYHLANLVLGIGLLGAALGFIGLATAAVKKHAWAIALAVFFVAYYVLIGRAEVKFIRYTFPLYIGLGVGFGWLMGYARERAGAWHGVVAFGLLGLGGVPGGGLQSSARYTAWMMFPDPRESAGKFLAGQNVTVGVVADPWFYTPSFHPELGMRMIYRSGMPMVAYGPYEAFDASIASMSSPRIARYVPLDTDGSRLVAQRAESFDIRLLTETKPDYVVYSSFEIEGLDRIKVGGASSQAAKDTLERAESFFAKLKTDYQFDRQFGADYDKGHELVHDMMYIQPTIYVYKRK